MTNRNDWNSQTTDTNDWNSQIIEAFRTNEGNVSGMPSLILLTTIGAKTGQRRTNPVMYLPDGDRLLIFASNAGAPTNSDWYYNLLAHPQVTVEVGSETYDATATEIHGEERDRFFAKQAEVAPQFGEYQKNTSRKIPAIALERNKG